MMFLLKIFVGMLVGSLVGLTGLGGAVLLLPFLVFSLGITPIVAVGSDAAFNALTKLGAGFFHWRRGMVNWRLVAALSLGSLPGALMGVSLLAHLRSVYGSQVNVVLRILIGVILVCIPVLLLLESRLERYSARWKQPPGSSYARVGAVGLLAGFLVGMSSAGSGSVILVFLMLLIEESPTMLVGTSVVHAFALTAFASLLHLRLGTIDPALLVPLLIGSVPGSLLGVRLSSSLPGLWLKRVLCFVLLAAGARMLFV